jgi:UDP-glucose 4-epimerase
MRVILTGGAGYIGSHTLIELLALGHEICVIDNFANSSPESLRRVRNISNRDFAVVTADIRDTEAMQRIFTDFRPDSVIHFAGLKAVGEGEAKPVEYYNTNITGTLVLLDAMDASGCQRIIFSSSATVYGDPDYLPLDEGHPCRPASVYGRTKYMAEQILADWCRARPASSIVLLRYFNPVGAHASGKIGEDPQDIPNNLMPYIAQVAVGRRDRLAIFGDDYETRDGTGLRDYIHVVDLARAHVAALNYAAGHEGTEIFNIGTGDGTTVKEMLAAYSRACGQDLPSQIVARRAGDIAACYSDPAKAKRLLGWNALLDIDSMCASSWYWQSENPKGYANQDEKGN